MRRLAAALALVAACTPATEAEVQAPTPPATVVESTSTTVPEGSKGSVGIGDRLYPSLGNGGYDVDTYDFSLSVALDGRVTGDAQIHLTPTLHLSQFNLDLSGLTVEDVTVAGFPDVTWEQEDRELIIDLAGTAVIGSDVIIDVRYSGVPEPVPASAVPFEPGWQVGTGSFYLFSQPDGASSLFPVNDHPMDRADVVLRVSVPTGVEVVSGGDLLSMTSAVDGDTFTWSMDAVAPYLIPLAIGQFDLVMDQTLDGVRYDVWASTPLAEDRRLGAFEIMPEVIGFFEERFGPYPFDRAGALIVDDDLAAALETQTIPTYTTVSAGWGEVVIAHELAHQWFGDAIALSQWDVIWLNEGFATFAHWLWLEESQGRSRYLAEITAAYRRFSGLGLVDGGLSPDDAVRRVVDAFPPPDDPRPADLFNASVYERGGLALAALREEVGDERLFELIRAYTTRFVGRAIDTETFIDLVDETLGASAADLTRSWVQDRIVPPFPSLGLQPPA